MKTAHPSTWSARVIEAPARAAPALEQPAFPPMISGAPADLTQRAYFAAHADLDSFALWDHIQEMRADRATYTNQDATTDEIIEAIADLKVRQADAIIRRLQTPPPD